MFKLSELIAENEDQIIVLRSILFDETGTEIISTVFFGRLKRIPEEYHKKYVYAFWHPKEITYKTIDIILLNHKGPQDDEG